MKTIFRLRGLRVLAAASACVFYLVGFSQAQATTAAKSYNYENIQFPSKSAMQNYQTKTARFIHSMLPLVDNIDNSLLKQREHLIKLHKQFVAGKTLSTNSIEWIKATAKHYKIKQFDFYTASDWKSLLARVDTIPPSLVIAQAANESAWGKSRFAKEANNYFGQHCYAVGCGIVPKQRKAGSIMEVAKFKSVEASIAAYMHNLNTHYTYKELREIRAKLRAAGKPVTGYALAAGLLDYSARGSAYVKSIRSIIKGFKLGQYDKPYSATTTD
jgi:Bax protein